MAAARCGSHVQGQRIKANGLGVYGGFKGHQTHLPKGVAGEKSMCYRKLTKRQSIASSSLCGKGDRDRMLHSTTLSASWPKWRSSNGVEGDM
jgi:hypothetical protein